jgi:CRISPR-associated exonuclease Cas4
MSYSEDDYLMISGIQHFMFCQRQWALIHIEQQWMENRLTAEGEVIHRNAHKDSFIEKRPGILVTRALRVASRELGLSGQCDVVEFLSADEGCMLHGHRGLWQAVPVEYKRGKDKSDDSDIFQLCAEALCLEEMLACRIPYGFLYYNEIRRRRKIDITEELRAQVKETVHQMHGLFERGYTPKVKPSKKCQSCSLNPICLPKLCKHISALSYMEKLLEENL